MAHFTAFSLRIGHLGTRTSARTAYCCSRSPGAASAAPPGRASTVETRRPESAAQPPPSAPVARAARSARVHRRPGPRRHAPPSRPRAPQPRTGRVFRGVFYTIHRPHRAPRAGASIEWRPQPRGQRGSLAPHARSVYRTSVLSLIAPVPRYASSTNQLQCAYPCAMPHI